MVNSDQHRVANLDQLQAVNSDQHQVANLDQLQAVSSQATSSARR